MMNINGKSIYLTEAPFEGEPTMLSTFRSGWNDSQWLIDIPVQMSTLKQVRPTGPVPVRIRFFDEQQVEHCFDSKMERVFYNPFYLSLQKVSWDQITRKERRRYPRIKVTLDLLLLQTNHHSLSLRTNTIDISGGGLCFQLPTPNRTHSGDIFTGFLFLHDKSIGFRCRIVRLLENGDGTQYIGAEFIKIEEKDREAIMSYCNNQPAHQATREKMMRG